MSLHHAAGPTLSKEQLTEVQKQLKTVPGDEQKKSTIVAKLRGRYWEFDEKSTKFCILNVSKKSKVTKKDITGFLAFYNAYDNEKGAESHAVLVVGVDGEDGGIGQTGIDEATSNNISVYTS